MTMKKITFSMLLMAVALLTSCSEQEYKLYDTKQTDAVFFDYKNANGDAADSVNYAFNYDIANTHTLELPVTLMGMPADHDRQITIKPVADSTDMVENVNYTIEGAILPANSVKGTIKVNLLRDKDAEIKTKAKRLVLRIEDGNDLRCVGKNIFRIIYSDIRPTKRPSWWTTTSDLPTYSFEAAQIFFKYFYERAPKANADIYNEIISRYGHYFVKARQSQGPMSMYDAFLKMYVLIPMYKDHPDLQWQDIPQF